MNVIIQFVALLILTALCVVGCQPSDSSTPSESIAPSEEAAPPETAEELSVDSVEETLSETAEVAKQAISDASAQAQELLTQAQQLVNEKQYQEAARLLEKLGEFELTPEQQKLLENLQATLQKGLESEAVKEGTKAIGNLLGGEE